MNQKVTDPKAFRFAAGTLTLEQGEGLRRFRGLAYSGQEVTDHPFWPKVIFDLASTRSPANIPVLLNHNGDQIVGHTDAVDISNEITVEGLLYANEADGGKVAARSDAGFPWQMSVHIVPNNVDEVKAGESVSVNGQLFEGPGFVFRQSRIREVSFTPVGADQRTHAVALSGLPGDATEITPMKTTTTQPEKDMSEITQEQFDTLKTERDALAAEVAELKEKLEKFSADQAAAAKAAREKSVKELFTAVGREWSDDEAKPYLSMDAETFAAVDKDLRAAKPAAPEHLFTEKATGSTSTVSPLVKDAERRAREAAGK